MITTVWGSPSQPGRAALPGDLGQLAADQRPVLDELVLVDSGHETLRPSVRLAEGADAIGGHRQKFRESPEAALCEPPHACCRRPPPAAPAQNPVSADCGRQNGTSPGGKPSPIPRRFLSRRVSTCRAGGADIRCISPNPARLDGVAVREAPGAGGPVLSGTPAGRVNPSAGEPCRRLCSFVCGWAVRGGGPMPGRQVVAPRVVVLSWAHWLARAVRSGAGAVVEVGGEGGVAASAHFPAQRRVG